MNEVSCTNEIKNIYDAIECFKQRFLVNHMSIFTDSEVFTQDNLAIIVDRFVNNPDESNSSFDEKIKKQLGEKIEVHELFAHVIWLWSIFASDMTQEGKINDINKWLPEDKKISNKFLFVFNHGIGSTGQYHKTNKPAELVYIIRFFQQVITSSEPVDYVNLLKSGVATGAAPQEVKVGNSVKKVAMYNILLHLFDPNNFETIASYGHKEKIASFFESQFNDLYYGENPTLDDKLKIIRTKCEEAYNDRYYYEWNDKDKVFKYNKFNFYHPDIEKLWKSDIVLESKNMILHGAPGTGKTYSVENSIKNRLEFLRGQDANKQFKLVQFHPSYGYEDFIDGIKPSDINQNGNMTFELVNGEFKQMCIDAFKELEDAKNEKRNPKKYYFIADEINRAELSRVFGELLLCIEDDKRLGFDESGKLIGTKVKTQNSKLWKQKHAVVSVDDEYFFGVPENLYFIGTMNDIDRSVESFDMALRRRFFWKHYRCNYDVISEKFSGDKNIDGYLEICKALNQRITTATKDGKGFNLGEAYELGHSYFMKIDTINATLINRLWANHIAPLLKEYMRSEYSQNDIDGKLEDAKKIFSLKQ
jgi:hypothetical protein